MIYLLAFAALVAPIALAICYHLHLSETALANEDEREIQKLLS